MPAGRYPRICFDQLLRTAQGGSGLRKYNWAAQVEEIIAGIGFGDVWVRMDAKEIAQKRPLMVGCYRTKMIYADYERVLNSSYTSLYNSGLSFNSFLPEKYLNSCLTQIEKRVLAQLRLSNRYMLTGWSRGERYEIDQRENCLLCNRGKKETLFHVFCECSQLGFYRLKYLGFRRLSQEHLVQNLLSGKSTVEVKMTVSYFLAYIRLRNFKRKLLEEAGFEV